MTSFVIFLTFAAVIFLILDLHWRFRKLSVGLIGLVEMVADIQNRLKEKG